MANKIKHFICFPEEKLNELEKNLWAMRSTAAGLLHENATKRFNNLVKMSLDIIASVKSEK